MEKCVSCCLIDETLGSLLCFFCGIVWDDFLGDPKVG